MSYIASSSSLSIRLKRELPPTAPIPGLFQTAACRRIPLSYFEWCRARHGNTFTMYPVDMAPVVFLSDPLDIQTVLTAPANVLHPGAGGATIAPIVGEGSFMLRDEDEHLVGRRATSPMFTAGAVRGHLDMVAEVVGEEVEAWPLDTPFAAHPRLRSLTLKVILRIIFGKETADVRVLRDRILEMLTVTTSFVLAEPRLRHLPGWRQTWRRFVRNRHAVDELISALINRARHAGSGEHSMLEMLLGTRNTDGTAMSKRQVRDHIMSMILAGHETTASELAWAFQLLAHNPEVQDRLASEIESGEGDAYLTATIQEVLRHRPVFVFAIPRVVVETIEIGGWTYRPTTQLLGCIYLMHHDPALYPDPHTFCPERFLGARPQASTWLPWGGGRKRCPGHHLATAEMRTVLKATLLQRSILPASTHIESARWRSVIVTPCAGSRIVLRSRRHRAPA